MSKHCFMFHVLPNKHPPETVKRAMLLLPTVILRTPMIVVEKHWVAFWRRSPQHLTSVITNNRTRVPIFS